MPSQFRIASKLRGVDIIFPEFRTISSWEIRRHFHRLQPTFWWIRCTYCICIKSTDKVSVLPFTHSSSPVNSAKERSAPCVNVHTKRLNLAIELCIFPKLCRWNELLVLISVSFLEVSALICIPFACHPFWYEQEIVSTNGNFTTAPVTLNVYVNI